jgi:TatD DNase family protein
MTLQLADTHSHIQEPQFDADRAAVIDRALAAGLALVMVPGVDLASSFSAARLAAQDPRIVAAAGYHPHEAEHYGDPEALGIEALLADDNVVAVGEVGLDYYRMLSRRDVQLEVFDAMLDLAAEHALPVVVHTREASDDMLDRLTAWSKRVASKMPPPFGVMHYFSEDLARARVYCDLGFLISIHTSVTHPRSAQMREVAAGVPLEALVLETDAPYGAPQSRRGSRNEPAFVHESAALIAGLREISLEALASATTANARRLFRVPAPVREGALP